MPTNVRHICFLSMDHVFSPAKLGLALGGILRAVICELQECFSSYFCATLTAEQADCKGFRADNFSLDHYCLLIFISQEGCKIRGKKLSADLERMIIVSHYLK